MRLTNTLLRQHIGFFFKKHWLQQGKRVPNSTGAEEELAARGIRVVDPEEVLKEQRPREHFHIPGMVPPPVAFDETHPLWQQEQAYVFRDSNVLLEGVRQAQCLLNTVVFDDLPLKIEEKLDQTKLPNQLDRSMQQSVLSALVFDTEQVKTTIIKVPERPAFKLPRAYGISEGRRNLLILSKLVTHCERFAGPSVNANRKVVYNAQFLVPITKDGERTLLNLKADSMIISNAPIHPLDTAVYRPMDQDLPALFPLKETVSIPQHNIYDWRNEYPINRNYPLSHPHTVLIHCSSGDVKNATELPVTRDQIEGRTMVKAFSVAAARARQLYGDDVKTLPQPITVQAVQTDSKSFHFSVYQLNTLDLSSSTERNMWFRKAPLDLYSECGYVVGKPTLENYNKDVLRHFTVFYSS
ncbi:large ribosomal subunit protein mL37 [Anopheles ziemanni]|uniref:large ribosomal subunit protein mL37 n=1 Tax=Anopheles coustani TaxID=139045 RepID=UPI002657EFF7|nr:large ribosomal subunit protein mL37 [Anopheles coustani]XP_058172492.1 large ribosomal subunit protein mL37 [Anopheles ziemanni]